MAKKVHYKHKNYSHLRKAISSEFGSGLRKVLQKGEIIAGREKTKGLPLFVFGHGLRQVPQKAEIIAGQENQVIQFPGYRQEITQIGIDSQPGEGYSGDVSHILLRNPTFSTFFLHNSFTDRRQN